MSKPRESDTFDIIVCGAGTAGAGAAYQLARVGKRVALLDRLPFAKAGARWINAVALVVVTMSRRKLQESEGRYLKLISGAVVGILGLLLFKPEWLTFQAQAGFFATAHT